LTGDAERIGEIAMSPTMKEMNAIRDFILNVLLSRKKQPLMRSREKKKENLYGIKNGSGSRNIPMGQSHSTHMMTVRKMIGMNAGSFSLYQTLMNYQGIFVKNSIRGLGDIYILRN